MSFINQKKFKEISEAGKRGDEVALKVLQALRKQSKQEDIDRLVGDFYKIGKEEILPSVENVEVKEEDSIPDVEIETPSEKVEVKQENPTPNTQVTEVEAVSSDIEPQNIDISDLLDKEMDGLIDENELDDYSFDDFLKDKKKNGNKLKKDNAYFKAFDQVGKDNYIFKKKNDYANKFNGKRGKIERDYRDVDIALDDYVQSVNDMLDDNIEFDMGTSNSAYDDIVGNGDIMSGIGRYWDYEDNSNIKQVLTDLVAKYGKKNVLATLNTLRSDNDNYHNYKNSQIDEEINRYNKEIEKLLK